jgi:hypothetical protein
MAMGPGKYDDAATLVRETTGAAGVVVVVLGGVLGDGYATQVASTLRAELETRRVVRLLRLIADDLERSATEELAKRCAGSDHDAAVAARIRATFGGKP